MKGFFDVLVVAVKGEGSTMSSIATASSNLKGSTGGSRTSSIVTSSLSLDKLTSSSSCCSLNRLMLSSSSLSCCVLSSIGIKSSSISSCMLLLSLGHKFLKILFDSACVSISFKTLLVVCFISSTIILVASNVGCVSVLLKISSSHQ